MVMKVAERPSKIHIGVEEGQVARIVWKLRNGGTYAQEFTCPPESVRLHHAECLDPPVFRLGQTFQDGTRVVGFELCGRRQMVMLQAPNGQRITLRPSDVTLSRDDRISVVEREHYADEPT